MGNDEGGGELDGGSNKSDKSEAEPGENGESRSISIGEPLSPLRHNCVQYLETKLKNLTLIVWEALLKRSPVMLCKEVA